MNIIRNYQSKQTEITELSLDELKKLVSEIITEETIFCEPNNINVIVSTAIDDDGIGNVRKQLTISIESLNG